MDACVIDQAQGENWVLYHGDCVDAMRGLPDKSIHYSIFSPPSQTCIAIPTRHETWETAA